MVNYYTDEDEDHIIDNSCRLDSNYGAIIIESPVANGLHPRGPHPSGPYGGNDHHKNDDDDYGKEREEEDESEEGKERNGARKSSKRVDWPAGRGKAVFIIVILTLLNAANKLDRFVLFEVIKDMAADLEFGDRSCLNSSVTFDPETDVEERIKYACAPDSCDGSSPMSIKEGLGEPHNDGDDEAPCQWQYWGTGIEYQLLAGPAFIVVVGLMRIPMTFMMERGHVDGRHVLVVCAVAWSLATLMTGFATTLWHVVICRILLGLFQAPFSPFSVAIVTSYFPPRLRGLSISVLNSGYYLGFGLAFAMGFVREIAGWRWAYRLASLPGFIIAFLMLPILRNPTKLVQKKQSSPSESESSDKVRLWDVLSYLHWAAIVPLTLGSALRFGATYIYNYNLNNFLLHYFPHYPVYHYLCWLPIISVLGSVISGGVLSDKAWKRYGVAGRLCLQIAMSVISVPLIIAALFINPPLVFSVSSIGTSISDSWQSSTVSALSELVPPSLHPSFFAVYYCILNTVGGTLNITLPAMRRALGFRYAMLAEVIGLITLGTVLFAVGYFATICRGGGRSRKEGENLGKNANKSEREERVPGRNVNERKEPVLDGNVNKKERKEENGNVNAKTPLLA